MGFEPSFLTFVRAPCAIHLYSAIAEITESLLLASARAAVGENRAQAARAVLFVNKENQKNFHDSCAMP